MRIRFHPCDLPYLCISDWHMSTPYHHPQRRILASVPLEVMPGFNLYLNSGGSFFVPTYSTATSTWTS